MCKQLNEKEKVKRKEVERERGERRELEFGSVSEDFGKSGFLVVCFFDIFCLLGRWSGWSAFVCCLSRMERLFYKWKGLWRLTENEDMLNGE